MWRGSESEEKITKFIRATSKANHEATISMPLLSPLPSSNPFSEEGCGEVDFVLPRSLELAREESRLT